MQGRARTNPFASGMRTESPQAVQREKTLAFSPFSWKISFFLWRVSRSKPGSIQPKYESLVWPFWDLNTLYQNIQLFRYKVQPWNHPLQECNRSRLRRWLLNYTECYSHLETEKRKEIIVSDSQTPFPDVLRTHTTHWVQTAHSLHNTCCPSHCWPWSARTRRQDLSQLEQFMDSTIGNGRPEQWLIADKDHSHGKMHREVQIQTKLSELPQYYGLAASVQSLRQAKLVCFRVNQTNIKV